MRYQFIDHPQFKTISDYEHSIDKMVKSLSNCKGIVSIYQIGNVSNPGISDIDLLVVFEDDICSKLNPTQNLSKQGRYLFTHNLFGVSLSHFVEAQKYTFFHNYKLLWGKTLETGNCHIDVKDLQVLKAQIALEYLFKMYINITIQITFRIIKVRALLLVIKALAYDLEFLGVTSGNFHETIQTLVRWRHHWFTDKPKSNEITQWIPGFYEKLATFLSAEIDRHGFYLPEEPKLKISKNIFLVPGERFGHKQVGPNLPPIFGVLGRKYFNLQHRFRTFYFYLIPSPTCKDSIIEARFLFLKSMIMHNRDKLRYFSPLSSSLNFI